MFWLDNELVHDNRPGGVRAPVLDDNGYPVLEFGPPVRPTTGRG
jgi:hypothetical protein